MEKQIMSDLQKVSIQDFYEPKILGKLSDLNTEHVKAAKDKGELPENVSAPSPQLMKDLESFMRQYRKNNPRASKREVRRACQRNFDVKIFRKSQIK